MTWFYVDDQLADHRKTRKAGTAAMGLWVLTGSWCAGHLTDGFIPAEVARRYGTTKQADRLITVGLWEASTRHDEDGYQFVNWGQWQKTREQVEHQRAKTRERVAEHRTRKATAESPNEKTGANRVQKDARTVTQKSEEPQVNDTCNAVSNAAPVPSRREGTLVSRASTSSVDANEDHEQPHEPPRGPAITGPRAVDAKHLVQRLLGTRHPATVRTALAIQAATLLREYDEPTVTTAIHRWLNSPGKGPGILPHIVSDLIREQDTPAAPARNQPARGGRGAKVEGWLALGQQAMNAQAIEPRPFGVIEGGRTA